VAASLALGAIVESRGGGGRRHVAAWQEGFLDGKSSTAWFVRLAGAGVDYVYRYCSPCWGVTTDLLLLCGLLAW
jgi:hypothetical protein